jgi:hypothetical protein
VKAAAGDAARPVESSGGTAGVASPAGLGMREMDRLSWFLS